MIRESLRKYLLEEIVPRYAAFDPAHREDHAMTVAERALQMGKYFDIDEEILLTAAVCHDLGLAVGRDNHHMESGRIVRCDKRMEQWFTQEQIEIIAQAAEDHRASSNRIPRSIYGRLVAEADRMIEPLTVIRRTIQYGLAHYPELDKESHWMRMLLHLEEKYAEGGYLHLYVENSINAAPLEELRSLIADRKRLRSLFESVYSAETTLSVSKNSM